MLWLMTETSICDMVKKSCNHTHINVQKIPHPEYRSYMGVNYLDQLQITDLLTKRFFTLYSACAGCATANTMSSSKSCYKREITLSLSGILCVPLGHRNFTPLHPYHVTMRQKDIWTSNVYLHVVISNRVWHLDFRLGARKGLLINLVVKSRFSVLWYIYYFGPLVWKI